MMFGKAADRLARAEIVASRVQFDRKSGLLDSGGRAKRLEPKAASVFAELADRHGELVSREELLDRCWGAGEGTDEALTQAIAQIRRAFDELGETNPIETLAKRGYRLSDGAATPRLRAPAMQSGRRNALLIALLAGLLVLAYLQPHWLRHLIRHNLGLGPSQSFHSRSR